MSLLNKSTCAKLVQNPAFLGTVHADRIIKICAYCNEFDQIEIERIATDAGWELSHGICPAHYQEILDTIKENK